MEREGLTDRVEIRLQDYRDIPKRDYFDKASSVGMFEHVGRARLGEYFGVINRVLKEGGWLMNHGITANQQGDEDGHYSGSDFMDKYVLPDGEIPHLWRLVHVQWAQKRSREQAERRREKMEPLRKRLQSAARRFVRTRLRSPGLSWTWLLAECEGGCGCSRHRELLRGCRLVVHPVADRFGYAAFLPAALIFGRFPGQGIWSRSSGFGVPRLSPEAAEPARGRFPSMSSRSVGRSCPS